MPLGTTEERRTVEVRRSLGYTDQWGTLKTERYA